MRVLIYALNFAPELVGAARYTTMMAADLLARGHRVEVITATPHFPQWRPAAGFAAGRFQRRRHAGMSVLHCPLWLPQRLHPLSRILCVLSFALTSFLPLLRASRRADVIVVIEPSLLCLPGAWLAGRVRRIPVWLHVQDFESAALGVHGARSGAAWLQAIAWVESRMMRAMHRVSTISAPMLERLHANGVDTSRSYLLPNGVDCNTIRPDADAGAAFRRLHDVAASDLVVLYAGSLGMKQGLELLVEAAAALADEPAVRVVIVGDGPAGPMLQARAAGLPNVRFLPPVEADGLNALLNAADLHVLPTKGQTSALDAFFPSKLGGMLASGKAVIATALPQTTLAQAVESAGIVVPPDDPPALAAAIRMLARDPVRRERLGAAGRRIAETRLDQHRILDRFAHALEDAIAHP